MTTASLEDGTVQPPVPPVARSSHRQRPCNFTVGAAFWSRLAETFLV